MKRFIIILLAASSCMLAARATQTPSSAVPEKTIILRVRAVGSPEYVTFSGTYQAGGNASPVRLNNKVVPFGVRVKADSLHASLRKQEGKPDLLVELIEFRGDNEVGSVTKTGSTFEIDISESGGESQLSIK